MPDASIVVTMDDKYSDAVKKMSSVTKAFSKDVKQLENVLYALGKNKISLQIDLGKVKSELKAAEKQFQQTQSAADGFNLELIQANYDHIARNLETVTRAVGQTEEAISQAENQAGGGDTQAPNKLIKAVASSGIGQMFKDVMLNAGTAVAGSMLGAEGGRVQTAVEARSERRSPAITITGNSFSIREDADVDRGASALLQKIELAERRG